MSIKKLLIKKWPEEKLSWMKDRELKKKIERGDKRRDTESGDKN